MDTIKCQSLFHHSSFAMIEKNCFDSVEVQSTLEKLSFQQDLSKLHPDRKKEYLLSRVLVYQILKDKYNFELNQFSSNNDRSPVWPTGFTGSISHSKDSVVVAISNQAQFLGIDLENLGRMKPELENKILIEEDIKSCEGLTRNQLTTLIFCAKEAYYKALYPSVKKFFGFDYAFISKISIKENSFEINLIKAIDENWTPTKVGIMTGKFLFSDQHCLAIIESKSIK